jgi:Condensation domain
MSSFPTDQHLAVAAVDFDPFAGGEVLKTAPATEPQKEIWASVQMGDDANCAYNESVSLWLRGELDVNALRSAFQQLVQRHEALRTTFSPDGNNLCIIESPKIDVPLVDLSGLNDTQREQKIADAKQQAVSIPFDLEHGPLFRIDLLKLQPQIHLVILTAHHIVFDGWSWGIIIPELGKLYSAFCQGEIPDLEDPDRFSDYALMLEETEGSEDAIATETYWLQQFAKSVPVVDFPSDRPRPPLRTFDSAREDWQLSSDLVTGLKQLGRATGCSFMTTLLTGFEIFLHRLTGHDEIVVGIPAAGQAATGNYQLVGHCVNLLPLRSWVDGDQTFSDYLQLRRPIILDAYDHQQFTFGSLVKKLAIPRDSSRIPLVPIAFNLDQGLDCDRLLFADLAVEFTSNPRIYENFELFINATELGSTLTLECQYNTNLFDAATIRRHLVEFETLLIGIVANPDTKISQLPLLPEAEQQLLSAWLGTRHR